MSATVTVFVVPGHSVATPGIGGSLPAPNPATLYTDGMAVVLSAADAARLEALGWVSASPTITPTPPGPVIPSPTPGTMLMYVSPGKTVVAGSPPTFLSAGAQVTLDANEATALAAQGYLTPNAPP